MTCFGKERVWVIMNTLTIHQTLLFTHYHDEHTYYFQVERNNNLSPLTTAMQTPTKTPAQFMEDLTKQFQQLYETENNSLRTANKQLSEEKVNLENDIKKLNSALMREREKEKQSSEASKKEIDKLSAELVKARQELANVKKVEAQSKTQEEITRKLEAIELYDRLLNLITGGYLLHQNHIKIDRKTTAIAFIFYLHYMLFLLDGPI